MIGSINRLVQPTGRDWRGGGPGWTPDWTPPGRSCCWAQHWAQHPRDCGRGRDGHGRGGRGRVLKK